jgi:predicted transcriptional regulator of viral defense system
VFNLNENNQVMMYRKRGVVAGVGGRHRAHLAALHRAFPGPFNALQASSILGIELTPTRRLLAALASGGWLARVRAGWYISVPIEASEPSEWREDPWIVAGTLFAPSYIGGWSAAEHWELTDQIFRDVYVVAGKKVRPSRQSIQGTDFVIRSIEKKALFGTRRVWRRRIAVDVSDLHRTIVDVLDLPSAAGGGLHATELLCAYFDHADADPDRLIEYGDRLGRGTVFKRLGYLVERKALADASFIGACHGRITRGLSWLDPAGPRKGRIVSRWNLRVNIARLAADYEGHS